MVENKIICVLDASPITKHWKYLLLRSVVLPKVNYAPLVEFGDKIANGIFDNQYSPIDQMVFDFASSLFKVKDLSEAERNDFFTNSQSKGGLELVTPGLYYNLMKQ